MRVQVFMGVPPCFKSEAKIQVLDPELPVRVIKTQSLIPSEFLVSSLVKRIPTSACLPLS